MQGMAVNNSPAAQTISPPFLTSLPGTSSSTNTLSKSPVRHLPPRRKVFEISCFSGLFRTEVSGYTAWKPEARPESLTNDKSFKPRQFTFLSVQLFPVSSCQGGVLSRRPVVERPALRPRPLRPYVSAALHSRAQARPP